MVDRTPTGLLFRAEGGFVHMPDGYVFEQVPEGVSDEQLYARWLKGVSNRGGLQKRLTEHRMLNEALSQQRPEMADPVGPPDGIVPRPVQEVAEGVLGGALSSGRDIAQAMSKPPFGISDEGYKQVDDSTRHVLGEVQEKSPWAYGAGRAAPYTALPQAKTIPGAIVGNAVMAGATTRGDFNERLKTAAYAAGGTTALAPAMRTGSRVLLGRPNKITGSNKKLADLWVKKGGRIPPSKLRGDIDISMQNQEGRMRKTWRGAEMMAEVDNTNAKVLNRAVSKELGKQVDTLDDAFITERNTRAKDLFSEATANVQSKPSGAFFNALEGSLEKAARSGTDISALRATIKRWRQIAATSDVIDGDTWFSWRQTARDGAQKAWRDGQKVLANAYDDLSDSIESHVQMSLKGEQYKQLKEARKIWRILDDTDKTINELGNVSARKLHTRLGNKYGQAYKRGMKSSDYYDTARAANLFADRTPNSGTTQGTVGGEWSEAGKRAMAGGGAGGAIDAMSGMPGLASGVGATLGGMSVPAEKFLNRLYMTNIAERGLAGWMANPAIINRLSAATRLPERGIIAGAHAARERYGE